MGCSPLLACPCQADGSPLICHIKAQRMAHKDGAKPRMFACRGWLIKPPYYGKRNCSWLEEFLLVSYVFAKLTGFQSCWLCPLNTRLNDQVHWHDVLPW